MRNLIKFLLATVFLVAVYIEVAKRTSCTYTPSPLPSSTLSVAAPPDKPHKPFW